MWVWILEARSENGCENDIFALKQGQDLEKRGAHPTENCQEYPAPECIYIGYYSYLYKC